MHVIAVEFTLKVADQERFLERMKQQARDSLDREPRCRQFDVCLDPEDPCRVFLYELYDDEGAFQAHLESDHFKDFEQTTAGWVTDKQVRAWRRVA